jgi:hypothetical protein
VVAHYGLNRAVTNEALACGVLPFTSFSSDDTKFQLGQTQNLKLLV